VTQLLLLRLCHQALVLGFSTDCLFHSDLRTCHAVSGGTRVKGTRVKGTRVKGTRVKGTHVRGTRVRSVTEP
jgi:hypothetical protein